MSFENKVDLVLANISSNLSILHVFELLSLIPPWNKCMDNFIESLVVFVEMFLSNKGAIIMMHVDDLCVLKEIWSFLESYQLKVHMKWIVVDSSPHMNSEDSSSHVPPVSFYTYVFALYILLKLGLT
jgi:hypothetical protein